MSKTREAVKHTKVVYRCNLQHLVSDDAELFRLLRDASEFFRSADGFAPGLEMLSLATDRFKARPKILVDLHTIIADTCNDLFLKRKGGKKAIQRVCISLAKALESLQGVVHQADPKCPYDVMMHAMLHVRLAEALPYAKSLGIDVGLEKVNVNAYYHAVRAKALLQPFEEGGFDQQHLTHLNIRDVYNKGDEGDEFTELKTFYRRVACARVDRIMLTQKGLPCYVFDMLAYIAHYKKGDKDYEGFSFAVYAKDICKTVLLCKQKQQRANIIQTLNGYIRGTSSVDENSKVLFETLLVRLYIVYLEEAKSPKKIDAVNRNLAFLLRRLHGETTANTTEDDSVCVDRLTAKQFTHDDEGLVALYEGVILAYNKLFVENALAAAVPVTAADLAAAATAPAGDCDDAMFAHDIVVPYSLLADDKYAALSKLLYSVQVAQCKQGVVEEFQTGLVGKIKELAPEQSDKERHLCLFEGKAVEIFVGLRVFQLQDGDAGRTPSDKITDLNNLSDLLYKAQDAFQALLPHLQTTVEHCVAQLTLLRLLSCGVHVFQNLEKYGAADGLTNHFVYFYNTFSGVYKTLGRGLANLNSAQRFDVMQNGVRKRYSVSQLVEDRRAFAQRFVEDRQFTVMSHAFLPDAKPIYQACDAESAVFAASAKEKLWQHRDKCVEKLDVGASDDVKIAKYYFQLNDCMRRVVQQNSLAATLPALLDTMYSFHMSGFNADCAIRRLVLADNVMLFADIYIKMAEKCKKIADKQAYVARAEQLLLKAQSCFLSLTEKEKVVCTALDSNALDANNLKGLSITDLVVYTDISNDFPDLVIKYKACKAGVDQLVLRNQHKQQQNDKKRNEDAAANVAKKVELKQQGEKTGCVTLFEGAVKCVTDAFGQSNPKLRARQVASCLRGGKKGQDSLLKLCANARALNHIEEHGSFSGVTLQKCVGDFEAALGALGAEKAKFNKHVPAFEAMCDAFKEKVDTLTKKRQKRKSKNKKPSAKSAAAVDAPEQGGCPAAEKEPGVVGVNDEAASVEQGAVFDSANDGHGSDTVDPVVDCKVLSEDVTVVSAVDPSDERFEKGGVLGESENMPVPGTASAAEITSEHAERELARLRSQLDATRLQLRNVKLQLRNEQVARETAELKETRANAMAAAAKKTERKHAARRAKTRVAALEQQLEQIRVEADKVPGLTKQLHQLSTEMEALANEKLVLSQEFRDTKEKFAKKAAAERKRMKSELAAQHEKFSAAYKGLMARHNDVLVANRDFVVALADRHVRLKRSNERLHETQELLKLFVEPSFEAAHTLREKGCDGLALRMYEQFANHKDQKIRLKAFFKMGCVHGQWAVDFAIDAQEHKTMDLINRAIVGAYTMLNLYREQIEPVLPNITKKGVALEYERVVCKNVQAVFGKVLELVKMPCFSIDDCARSLPGKDVESVCAAFGTLVADYSHRHKQCVAELEQLRAGSAVVRPVAVNAAAVAATMASSVVAPAVVQRPASPSFALSCAGVEAQRRPRANSLPSPHPGRYGDHEWHYNFRDGYTPFEYIQRPGR